MVHRAFPAPSFSADGNRTGNNERIVLLAALLNVAIGFTHRTGRERTQSNFPGGISFSQIGLSSQFTERFGGSQWNELDSCMSCIFLKDWIGHQGNVKATSLQFVPDRQERVDISA